MKRSILVGFLAVGALAGCSIPEAQVGMVPGTTLNLAERAELREMQLDGHFGAYARSPEGAWAWTAGYNALSAARADALTMCNSDALADADCAVVFELLPVGDAPMISGKTMTIETSRELEKHMQRDGASAFAIAADGTYGHGWGYDTIAQAQERALMECNSRNLDRADDNPDLPVYPCAVVWTKPAPVEG